jgi:hypothetical protein
MVKNFEHMGHFFVMENFRLTISLTGLGETALFSHSG